MDTWHAALGLQFRPDEDWRLNTGFAYDSSFYRSQNDTSLTMPSGEAWRFGIGAQYQITPRSNVGLAMEYLTMCSSRVASEPFKGSYDDPSIYFVSASYSWQF
uniref:outer membrane protein transport protein n=1 Tax=Pantoea sp. IMH TaxID=1267600 RepID=UPI0004B96C90